MWINPPLKIVPDETHFFPPVFGNICQQASSDLRASGGFEKHKNVLRVTNTGLRRGSHLIGHHVEEVAVGAAAAHPLAGRHRAPERLLIDRDHSTFGHERPARRGCVCFLSFSSKTASSHPHEAPGGNAASERGTPLLNGPGGQRGQKKGRREKWKRAGGLPPTAGGSGPWGASSPWGAPWGSEPVSVRPRGGTRRAVAHGCSGSVRRGRGGGGGECPGCPPPTQHPPYTRSD